MTNEHHMEGPSASTTSEHAAVDMQPDATPIIGTPLARWWAAVPIWPALALLLFNLGLYAILSAQPAAVPEQDRATDGTQPAEPDSAPTPIAPTALPAAIPSGIPTDGLALAWSDDAWLPLAGEWMVEDGSLVQQQVTGYDRIISHHDVWTTPVTLRVSFRHREGSGGGILFGMPQQEARNGAHMVRYADDDHALFWGYFDKAGVFTGQGAVQVPGPGTTQHTLEIISDEQTYAIHLDGQRLVEGVPLIRQQGHIGLVASQSVVAFDAVEVLPTDSAGIADAALPTSGVELSHTLNLDDLSFMGGNWTQAGTTIRQNDTANTDFVSLTGVSAETYTLSVTITMTDAADIPDVGGGIIFHMPGRQEKQGAHMVRFGGAGSEIFWGYFDMDNTFIGQGQATLEPAPGEPHILALVVSSESYTVLVDDIPVARDIPLQRQGGWIGLLSFRGPVIFSNFNLRLGV